MQLDEAFAQHLRGRSDDELQRTIVDGLQRVGRELEAELYERWCGGRGVVSIEAGPWSGRVALLRPSAPRLAAVGEIWFDVCELAAMVHVGRAWLAIHPVQSWQMSGFLAVARDRPLADGGGGAAAQLTESEATMYAWWFGKALPHRFDWEGALASLPGELMRELWIGSSREWTGTKLATDDRAALFVTPSTISWNPDEIADEDRRRPERRRAMIRHAGAREPDIGFRTAVLTQIGLFREVSAWDTLHEGVDLSPILDRAKFADPSKA
jgi:hypothetical protein